MRIDGGISLRRRTSNLTIALAVAAIGSFVAGCAGAVASKSNESPNSDPQAPSIKTQPSSQSVSVGQIATFSVLATGTASLNYQWQKNGANVTGATSAAYSTPPTSAADNGATFQVVINNSVGSVMSNRVSLTVNPSAVAPTITRQPTNQTVTTGQTATFTVAATGTAPLSYQWQKAGAAISGASSASYTTPATTSSDNGTTFSVVVINSAGSITSTSATLTVNPSAVAPTITRQPTNQTVTTGQTATFTVAATGTAPLSYQWQKAGAAISGASSVSYTTPATTSSDNGTTFSVVVSNSAGSTTSTSATLTVNPSAVAPTITTQPANQTVTTGQTATFTVAATGTAPLSYQWQKAGAAISGASSASYITPATTSSDNGTTFSVVVSNSAGSTTSTSATLNVTAAGQLMVLSPDKTHLVNTLTNKPVFITGEDAWDLATQVDNADAVNYLSSRAQQGYNFVWMAAVDNTYQSNPPANYYGNVPFDGADFTNEDATYWAHVDYVIQQAATYGITIGLSPAFVGLNSTSGYLTSYENSSDATMTAYGAWLGNRYKSYPNIIWVLGGDMNVSAVYGKVADVAVGIASSDQNHAITVETYHPNSSVTDFPVSSNQWLGMNWTYANYSIGGDPNVVAACQNNYGLTPFLAPLQGEGWYELEHSITQLELDEQGYWAILSGCYLGQVFGNNAIWTMGGPADTSGQTWQSQIGSQGSVTQSWMGKLFNSREHWKLVPDINHTVLTAGYGSGSTISVAARTSDGQTIIAYIPNGNATTISIDMTKITSAVSTAQCWWFKPSDGTTVLIGSFANSGIRTFTPPDANDWVLVIDDQGANLPAPGSASL